MGGQFSRVSEATVGQGAVWEGGGVRIGEKGVLGKGVFFLFVFFLLFLESEVAGAGVAVVVELLLDVDHVAAGVLQLSELGPAAEVSKIAELGQPRPGRGVCRGETKGNTTVRGDRLSLMVPYICPLQFGSQLLTRHTHIH